MLVWSNASQDISAKLDAENLSEMRLHSASWHFEVNLSFMRFKLDRMPGSERTNRRMPAKLDEGTSQAL